MKERVLFHLRLEVSRSPRFLPTADGAKATAARRNGSSTGEGAVSSDIPNASPTSSRDKSRENSSDTATCRPVCTCMDSSSESCVVVGFERGLVHVYDRETVLPQAGGADVCTLEEEKWRRTAVYPPDVVTSPIKRPADITCVQMGPSGMLAAGTSDGVVFVKQVHDSAGCCVALLSPTATCGMYAGCTTRVSFSHDCVHCRQYGRQSVVRTVASVFVCVLRFIIALCGCHTIWTRLSSGLAESVQLLSPTGSACV